MKFYILIMRIYIQILKIFRNAMCVYSLGFDFVSCLTSDEVLYCYHTIEAKFAARRRYLVTETA